jgi:hypothetical protein
MNIQVSAADFTDGMSAQDAANAANAKIQALLAQCPWVYMDANLDNSPALCQLDFNQQEWDLFKGQIVNVTSV